MKPIIILIALVICLLIVYFISNLKFNKIDLSPLSEFANNYSPCEEKYIRFKTHNTVEFCTEFPIVPNNVKFVLDWHAHDKEYIKSILLIAIKLYNRQFEMNHQTYDLRENKSFYFNRYDNRNSILRAFSEIVGKNIVQKKTGGEFLNPSQALVFIENNKEYLKYPEISLIYHYSDSLSNELNK